MSPFGRLLLAGLGGVLCSGCAPARPAETAAATRQQRESILLDSSPAAGSTVPNSVEELVLRFDPPARLQEVTVIGPQGAMPTMIHAVGETQRYSLPLSGLVPGTYSVNWRATAQSREYRGTFGFNVSG